MSPRTVLRLLSLGILLYLIYPQRIYKANLEAVGTNMNKSLHLGDGLPGLTLLTTSTTAQASGIDLILRCFETSVLPGREDPAVGPWQNLDPAIPSPLLYPLGLVNWTLTK